MSKVADYLQEHLHGEVFDSSEIRKYFSTDASFLQLSPTAVVYPRNENDVRKSARFCWQLAERNQILPITCRGSGSDTSGAAIGSGLVIVFPTHMNKILAFDPKKQLLIAEPGASSRTLDQTLGSQGFFLPALADSKPYSTIGGALSTDSVSQRSVKYGGIGQQVQQLRVVLANGELIEVGPINKRELSRKLGLTSFEGQVYRQLDALLEENAEILSNAKEHIKSIHNASGYNLWDVRYKKGFNLVPLFVGSQGTLGLITEASVLVTPKSPETDVALVSIDDLSSLNDILPKILQISPSMCSFINKAALDLIHKLNPHQLKGVLSRPDAALHLFIEFDNAKENDRKKYLKLLQKISAKADVWFEPFSQHPDKFWKLLQSVSTILVQPSGYSKAVPVAEDVSLPLENLSQYLQKAESIYSELDLHSAAWGMAGSGLVRVQPMLNLSEVGDRQKLFGVAEKLYEAAIQMGGSITGSVGDGRVRAPYLQKQYGEDYYQLMLKVKKIFDPYNILNPGVKTASLEEVKALVRSDYNLNHLHPYLPSN